jgi:hypothetical protein
LGFDHACDSDADVDLTVVLRQVVEPTEGGEERCEVARNHDLEEDPLVCGGIRPTLVGVDGPAREEPTAPVGVEYEVDRTVCLRVVALVAECREA